MAGNDLDKVKSISVKQNDLMPTGIVGKQIDWSKVFESNRMHHKRPLNWNLLLDEKGEFDEKRFIMSNIFSTKDRVKLLEQAPELLERMSFIKNKTDNVRILYYDEILDSAIRLFKRFYYLGNQNEDEGEITNVYVQEFFIKLNEIFENLKNKGELIDDTDGNMINLIDDDISSCISKGLEWVENKWGAYETEMIESFKDGASKYMKPGNILDVDKVLETLNSHWSWTEDYLIYAFYTTECSKDELEKLQTGVLEALDSKFKNLDNEKIFSIIDFILPYVFDGYNNIKFDFPELFRPEYLGKINIMSLTLKGFINQVEYLGKEHNWSSEIQAKLIEQFKEYGTSKSGQIGFGQGSEQLRYWSSVTSHVTPENYEYYLKDENLGEDKRPLPKILRDKVDETTKSSSDKVLEIIENK